MSTRRALRRPLSAFKAFWHMGVAKRALNRRLTSA
jgi:hypothetical protein